MPPPQRRNSSTARSSTPSLSVPNSSSNNSIPLPNVRLTPEISPTPSRRSSYFGSVNLDDGRAGDDDDHHDGRVDRPLLGGGSGGGGRGIGLPVDGGGGGFTYDGLVSKIKALASPQGRVDISDWLHGNSGLLLIAFSQAFFACMNASVKFLKDSSHGGGFPTLELVGIRMAVTLIGCIGYLFWSGDPNPVLGPPGVRTLLAVRGVIGFFGLTGMYQSLQHLSLSDATTLGFLSPTCTALLGYLILKEPFTRKEATAGCKFHPPSSLNLHSKLISPHTTSITTVISLLGVILIARPTALFGSSSAPTSGLPVAPDWGDGTGSRTSWHDKVYDTKTGAVIRASTQGERLGAVGWALMGVAGSAGAYTAIRAIGHRAKPFHSIVYFSFYCVVVSVLGMAIFQVPPVAPKGLGWVMIMIIGGFGLFAQLFLTMGLQREKAGRGSLAMYTQLLFAGIIERVLFHVEPSFMSLLGTVIILGAALWVAFSKQEKPKDIESGNASNNRRETTSPLLEDGGNSIPLTRHVSGGSNTTGAGRNRRASVMNGNGNGNGNGVARGQSKGVEAGYFDRLDEDGEEEGGRSPAVSVGFSYPSSNLGSNFASTSTSGSGTSGGAPGVGLGLGLGMKANTGRNDITDDGKKRIVRRQGSALSVLSGGGGGGGMEGDLDGLFDDSGKGGGGRRRG